jgi:hypothetical protein
LVPGQELRHALGHDLVALVTVTGAPAACAVFKPPMLRTTVSVGPLIAVTRTFSALSPLSRVSIQFTCEPSVELRVSVVSAGPIDSASVVVPSTARSEVGSSSWLKSETSVMESGL